MQNQHSQQLCVHCERPTRPGAMKYLLSDMAVEMLAWMEVKLKREVNEKSWLCGNCFASLGDSWSASQEPEVMDTSLPGAQGPDPLLVNRFHKEDVHIKTEDEPESFEHYDYKVEIDTSLSVDSQKDCKEFNYEEQSESELLDLEEVEECIEKEKQINDYDYVPDTHEMSSEDEGAQEMLSIPALLDGASLRSGTKCDGCKTLITKQPYRKLPDGPEKDYFVVNERDFRDVSPERVCNPCYLKAHAAVVKQQKKDDAESEQSSATSYINLPSYRRLANTSKRCLIGNCKGKNRLIVPDYLKVFLLKNYNIYVPSNARLCTQHSKEYIQDWSSLKEFKCGTEFSIATVTDMIELLRKAALEHPD